MKPTLVQAAWAAVRNKKSFFSGFYYRLKTKHGAKKAIIAVARKIAICAYWILKKNTHYVELGATYIDKNAIERKKTYYQKKLKELEAICAA